MFEPYKILTKVACVAVVGLTTNDTGKLVNPDDLNAQANGAAGRE